MAAFAAMVVTCTRGPRSFRCCRSILAVVMVAASLGAGCKESPTAPSDAQLGDPFDLRVGESAVLPGDLTMSFARVVSDSRCPADVICIAAGEARLALRLSVGSDAPVEREVRVAPAVPEVSFSSYTIRALALMPYPRSDRTPRMGEFVATFRVTR